MELRIAWLSDEAGGDLRDRRRASGPGLRAIVDSPPIRPSPMTSRQASPAEAGVAEMMVSVYREFDRRLAHRTLWDLAPNADAGSGMDSTSSEAIAAMPSRCRSFPAPRIGPPSITWRHHPTGSRWRWTRYIAWYERASTGGDRLAPLTCAGVAHLYFVFIHPFEDGNGRIGARPRREGARPGAPATEPDSARADHPSSPQGVL